MQKIITEKIKIFFFSLGRLIFTEKYESINTIEQIKNEYPYLNNGDFKNQIKEQINNIKR